MQQEAARLEDGFGAVEPDGLDGAGDTDGLCLSG